MLLGKLLFFSVRIYGTRKYPVWTQWKVLKLK